EDKNALMRRILLVRCENRLVHGKRSQVMNSCGRSGMMDHVLKMFGRLVEVRPPTGHSQLKEWAMFLCPPNAGFGIGEVQQPAFSWPEVYGVDRAVIVLRQVSFGQRFGIIAAFDGHVWLFNNDQVKPLVFQPSNHVLRVWPVEGLERQVSHLLEPEQIEDQGITRKAFSTKRLGDHFEFLTVAVPIARL